MFTPFVLWPWVAGLTIFLAGLFLARQQWAAASGMDKLIALGPVFFAAPLAVFGAEHLAGPQFLITMVPQWMPARMFWVYFVGIALIAAAASLISRKKDRLAATLLGIMFLLFVLMLHLPNAITHPQNRFAWIVVFRETSFAGGAWAMSGWPLARRSSRFLVAIPTIIFGVQHLLHPEHAPGVPLEMVTPAWFPVPVLWGYLVGLVLLGGGIHLLLSNQSRLSAAYMGLVETLIVVFLYVPVLAIASKPAEMTEGINYIADTLLFAGTILCVGGALPSVSGIAWREMMPSFLRSLRPVRRSVP